MPMPSWALSALDDILEALDGNRAALATKTKGAMTADFLLRPQGTHGCRSEIVGATNATGTSDGPGQ
jgi:hypothetical protein